MESNSGKDFLTKFDVKSLNLGLFSKNNPQNFKFFVSQKFEVLENDWYGLDQQSGLKYGSFILNPQIIEIDLSTVRTVGSIQTPEEPEAVGSSSHKNSAKPSGVGKPSGKSSMTDYNPLKPKEKDNRDETLKNVGDLLEKVLNKTEHGH